MDFFDVVKSRHSIRAFAATPIDRDKVQTILNAANRAPSAGNLQAYEIYMVTRDRDRSALARAALEQWFIGAGSPRVLCPPGKIGAAIQTAWSAFVLNPGCDDRLLVYDACGNRVRAGNRMGRRVR